jgi:hypothetical protein
LDGSAFFSNLPITRGDAVCRRARLEQPPYALDEPLASGTRPTLDSGQLGIVDLDAPGDSPRSPDEPGARLVWR